LVPGVAPALSAHDASALPATAASPLPAHAASALSAHAAPANAAPPLLPLGRPGAAVRYSDGSAGISAVLDVLEALDRRGAVTLSELARETGVAKSTLHRVCTTMGQRGWLARDRLSGQLELGPKVAWLARATPASLLTPAFHAVAVRLVACHNETTCLTVLDGRESVFVAKEETSHPVRLVTAVGSRLPAFASASGRVMLADLRPAEVDALYAGCELETPTGRRLNGLGHLHAILNKTRRRGYGENIDDTALGLHCIAAPLGPPGRVIAAITLCIPSGRMNATRKRELVKDLLAAATELVPGSSRQHQRKVDR
jgi:IclR family transcriptional regulator, KDG regulon repressor